MKSLSSGLFLKLFAAFPELSSSILEPCLQNPGPVIMYTYSHHQYQYQVSDKIQPSPVTNEQKRQEHESVQQEEEEVGRK